MYLENRKDQRPLKKKTKKQKNKKNPKLLGSPSLNLPFQNWLSLLHSHSILLPWYSSNPTQRLTVPPRAPFPTLIRNGQVQGHLPGSVGWASASWSQLKSWSPGCECKPHVGLCARHEVHFKTQRKKEMDKATLCQMPPPDLINSARNYSHIRQMKLVGTCCSFEHELWEKIN